MNRKLTFLAAAVVATFLFSSVAMAQLKIGVVDLQTAVASTKAGKNAKSKLEKAKNKAESAIEKRAEKIKKMEEEMQKQMPLMSEGGKKDMLDRYRKEMLELQEMVQQNQVKLAKKRNDLLEPILNKMGAIIQDLALSDGYTMIIDKSAGTVLYHEPTIDLTNEVVKRYNAKK